MVFQEMIQKQLDNYMKKKVNAYFHHSQKSVTNLSIKVEIVKFLINLTAAYYQVHIESGLKPSL